MAQQSSPKVANPLSLLRVNNIITAKQFSQLKFFAILVGCGAASLDKDCTRVQQVYNVLKGKHNIKEPAKLLQSMLEIIEVDLATVRDLNARDYDFQASKQVEGFEFGKLMIHICQSLNNEKLDDLISLYVEELDVGRHLITSADNLLFRLYQAGKVLPNNLTDLQEKLFEIGMCAVSSDIMKFRKVSGEVGQPTNDGHGNDALMIGVGNQGPVRLPQRPPANIHIPGQHHNRRELPQENLAAVRREPNVEEIQDHAPYRRQIQDPDPNPNVLAIQELGPDGGGILDDNLEEGREEIEDRGRGFQEDFPNEVLERNENPNGLRSIPEQDAVGRAAEVERNLPMKPSTNELEGLQLKEFDATLFEQWLVEQRDSDDLENGFTIYPIPEKWPQQEGGDAHYKLRMDGNLVTFKPMIKVGGNDVGITAAPVSRPASLSSLYPLNSRVHGLALILIIENVQGYDKLNGTHIDERNLRATFRFLGYRVEVKRNLKAQQIFDLFWCIIQEQDQSFVKETDESFVCCIISHGGNNFFRSHDNQEIFVRMVDNSLEMKLRDCSKLLGKPKLFFLSCCRGLVPNVEPPQREGDPNFWNPRRADFAFYYSTFPGDSNSNRYPSTGSVYIFMLCYYLCKHGTNSTLSDIHKLVSKRTSQYRSLLQVPCQEEQLFANVYFFEDMARQL